MSGKDETKWYFLFSLFLSLFKTILDRNEAIKVFFNFLNFLAIFLEFSITVRVRTKRNDSFFFSLSQSFLNYFGLKWSRKRIFEFFEYFCYFFEFSIMCLVRTKGNDNFYFLSASWFSYRFWIEIKP